MKTFPIRSGGLRAPAAGALPIAAVAVLFMSSFVHCVGDAPVVGDAGSDGDLTGSAGHPCFANRTCNGNLTCVSNACVNLSGGEGGVDGAGDGPVADAGRDGPDVGTDAAALATPLLHWTLDSDFVNTGSVANYPIVNFGAVFVPGKFGQGAQFGSSGYAQVLNIKPVLAANPRYTISLWVNAGATSQSQSFFTFIQSNGAPYGGLAFGSGSQTQIILCAAGDVTASLGNGCPVAASDTAGVWFNLIVRYDGTSNVAGGGADIQVYKDDGVPFVQANNSKEAVFGQGMADILTLGGGGIILDEIRVYDAVYTQAQQCTGIIGGTWSGSACTLP